MIRPPPLKPMSQKGVAPARESQQLGDARRDGRRADASGSLEDAGARDPGGV